MRWQDVSKQLLAAGSGLGVVGLLSLLFMLSGISHVDSGDSFQYECDRGICGDAFINISTTYWNFEFEHLSDSQSIYLPSDLTNFKGSLKKYKVSELNFTPVLYKKATRGRKLWVNLDAVQMIVDTQPNIGVDWMVPARGKDNWRPLKEGDTWSRGDVNRIKLVAYNIPEDTIVKWSFVVGEVNIDPFWFPYDYVSTLDYNYTFETMLAPVTKYHMVNISVSTPVYVNTTDEVAPCNDSNQTCFDCIGNHTYNIITLENITTEVSCDNENETCFSCEILTNETWCKNQTNEISINQTYLYDFCNNWTHEVIDHYNTISEMVNESYTDYEEVPNESPDKITGIYIEGQDYIEAPYIGGLAFYNNCLCMALIPPGERNWAEFPCRDFELEKGTYNLTCYGEGQ